MFGFDGHSMGNAEATNNSLQPSLQVLKRERLLSTHQGIQRTVQLFSYGPWIRSDTITVNQHEM